jgi:hypothetical protein
VKRLAVAIALVLVVVLGAGTALLAVHEGGPAASGPTPVAISGGAPTTRPPDAALAPY